MRIAFIVHDLNRSWGHSRYVAELAERFSREHEVFVFANTFVIDPGLQRIVPVKVPAWRSNAFTTVLTFLAAASLHSKRHFDIVHSQGLCGLGGNVTTAHQCNREWYLSRKRAGSVTFREWVFGTVVGSLEHFGYRTLRTSSVIAISHRIAADLKRHYHCTAPIHLIHHGTDIETFRPGRSAERAAVRREFGVDREQHLFLFLGDLRKGARECILAMRQFPDQKLMLVSRSDTARWKQMAETEGVADRVIFAGSTETAENFYAAADSFLCPTPYDPFALVVSEAMSSGLPVVVSRVAGASELVDHGRNGLILEDPNDCAELACLMGRLSEDRSFASQMGQAARRTHEGRTWDEVARQTMLVYQAQLAQRCKRELKCIEEFVAR